MSPHLLLVALHLLVGPMSADSTHRTDSVTAHRATGEIVGEVRDSATNSPQQRALVRLDGGHVTTTDEQGRFRFTQVDVGTHSIQATHIGMKPARRGNIVVSPSTPAKVTILVVPVTVKLSAVVVTPSSFGMLQDAAQTRRGLTRDEIETRPQLGEDIYRTMNRLPGVASSDFSARLHVRGSDYNELLVRFDGAQLYEPFHLKDIDGALSIVDMNVVNAVSVSTGGFGAEYGDRLTGVFDIRTSDDAPASTKTSLGLSASNVRATNSGSFADGEGQWLVSARRGYMDLALKLAGAPWPAKPRYGDVFAKVERKFAGTQSIAAHALYATDGFSYYEQPGYIVNSGYGDEYGWVDWKGTVGSHLSQQTVLSGAHLAQHRQGSDTWVVGKAPILQVSDVRGFDALGLSQDWMATLNDRVLFKGGVEVRHLAASYDYQRSTWQREVNADWQTNGYDTLDVDEAPAGATLGAYLSQRVRLTGALTVEGGARIDRHSYLTDDGAERKPSPRFSAAYALGGATVLRAAWGRYTQAQLPNEIDVADGFRNFAPVQVAEHRILGIERTMARGGFLRVEAYQRATSNVLPYAENLGGEVVMIPEAEPDRRIITPASSVARGVELYAGERTSKVDWSASYVLASTQDLVNGVWTPRPLDQRHTIVTDFTVRPMRATAVSASWQFHTGWPASIPVYVADADGAGGYVPERLTDGTIGSRVAPYHRLDLRVTRTLDFASGHLSTFVDVFNVLDHSNPAGFTYWPHVTADGRVVVDKTQVTLLPRLPSLGLNWEF